VKGQIEGSASFLEWVNDYHHFAALKLDLIKKIQPHHAPILHSSPRGLTSRAFLSRLYWQRFQTRRQYSCNDYLPRTTTPLRWDEKNFYVAAELEEPHMWATRIPLFRYKAPHSF
jgi:hypothetical protein